MFYSWNTMGMDGLSGMFTGTFLVVLLWSLVWKGLALYVTARRDDKLWFVVFLVFNTAGLGEIIYLLATDGFKAISKQAKK